MIERNLIFNDIQYAFKITPVCGLIGPRQSGKTTVARQIASLYSGNVHHFDLEDERDVNKLREPLLFLEHLEGLIIIDEIHHAPHLFKTLRVLIDQQKNRRFLILGSASVELLKQTSETLAGRITYVEMTPFRLMEVDNALQIHQRGGFPLSYLATDDEISYGWRKSYIKTFLEQDIPSLGFSLSPQNLRRFWTMIAHYHGGIFNASEIGNTLGINYKTVQSYLDILESTFMARRLSPWIANIKKRQIKAPKIYLTDSGILHTLLGIKDYNELINHPKLGASWEGFAIEQVISAHKAYREDCFYWRTQAGSELDLLITQHDKKIGFEFKYSLRPSMSKSLYSALDDLNLNHINVIIPGDDQYPINEQVTVYGLNTYCQTISRTI